MAEGGSRLRRGLHALHGRGRQGAGEEEVQVQQVGQLVPAQFGDDSWWLTVPDSC